MHFHLMMSCCKSSFTQFQIKFFAFSWIFILQDVANPVSHDSNKILCLDMNWNNMSFHQCPFANLVSHNLQWNLCIHMNLGNITFKIWWVLSKPLLHNLQFNFLKTSGIILRYLLTESYKIWLNNRILQWRTDFLD